MASLSLTGINVAELPSCCHPPGTLIRLRLCLFSTARGCHLCQAWCLLGWGCRLGHHHWLHHMGVILEDLPVARPDREQRRAEGVQQHQSMEGGEASHGCKRDRRGLVACVEKVLAFAEAK